MKQQRIEWLLLNQALWDGYPQGWSDKEHKIFDLMKLKKLYGRTTQFQCVNLGALIAQARKLRRERSAAEAGWRPHHD